MKSTKETFFSDIPLPFCVVVSLLSTVMNLPNQSFYNFAIAPGTRDHKGYFVQDGTYNLVRVESSGWAFICLDNHTCYYVDPESLMEVCDLEDRLLP